jgi:mannose-6-phosphate isomerase-like protein (cupin superfamily)
MIKLKQNTEHYIWGGNCDSWILLNSENLSIKQETMPPNSKEQLHFHKNAQQFFFILKGKAIFIVDEEVFEVVENSGFHITPNKNHLIKNQSDSDLEFLVISNPSTNNDRFAVEK